MPTPPHDGIREPPNSLASASDPNFQLYFNTISASAQSSGVFETGEKTKAMNVDLIAKTIKEVPNAGNIKQPAETERRPGTGKAVRFAENTRLDAPEVTEEEKKMKEKRLSLEALGGCKPQSGSSNKDQDNDDPDPNGVHAQWKLARGHSCISHSQSHQGETQGHSKGQDENRGQAEDNQDRDQRKVDQGKTSDSKGNLLQTSYNTVLFTSKDVHFPRQGTVLPAKQKKAPKVTCKVQISSGKPDEIVTDWPVLERQGELPTKDYYDQAAQGVTTVAGLHARPQSMRRSDNAHKKVLLNSRPISANVAANGKELKVQFVIKNISDIDDVMEGALPAASSRLNEMQCQRPLSARNQASTGPMSARSAMEATAPRSEQTRPAIDFKVEGSRMSQAIKAGLCTVCGKPSSKIADYWEETGTLICDVCDRHAHAEENRSIDWIRKQMHSVYLGECHEDGEPIAPQLMLLDKGEQVDRPITNMDDLEKALNAVHCEISEAIHKVWDGVTFADSGSSTSEDDEEQVHLESHEGVDHSNDPLQDQFTLQQEVPAVINAVADKMTSGEISKVLTGVNVDASTVAKYKMRVDWYKEYSQVKEKETAMAKEAKSQVTKKSLAVAKIASVSRNAGANEAQVKKSSNARAKDEQVKNNSSGDYEELGSATRLNLDVGGINSDELTVMTEKQDTVVNVSELLLQEKQPGDLVPKEKVKHFKGERVPVVNGLGSDCSDQNLGVSGTTKKLLRPPSAKKFTPGAVAPFAPLCFRINARPPPGFLYYFAYGVDMNADRMESYMQRPVRPDRLWGLLYGFQLVFNKRGVDVEAGAFPNVELSAASSVEGCLYLITLDELDMVDRHVGYPEHYDHAMLPVWLLNCTVPDDYGVAQYCVPALLMVAKDAWIHKGGATLSSEYAVEQCMKGGGGLLSPAYHEQLAALRT